MPTTLQQPPVSPQLHGIAGVRPLPMIWTADQFNHMGDLGWFEGRRPFLLDGIIWEQGPMNPLHANALYLVGELIRSIFAAGWVVRVQMPMRVDELNDPFPDLLVVTVCADQKSFGPPATTSRSGNGSLSSSTRIGIWTRTAPTLPQRSSGSTRRPSTVHWRAKDSWDLVPR